MPNKMLIDSTHPEETRVVVVRGNRVEEFDFETVQRKQLRGNIYLAKVTRVEPSLQAAFIEYGGNRHGFLAFSEIHPDYYQIPMADRLALIEADERAHREAEEESENRSSRRRPRHRNSRRRGNGERVQSEIVEGAPVDPSQADQPSTEHGDVEGRTAETGHDDYQHEHGQTDTGHAHDDDHSHDDHSHDHEAHHGDEAETTRAVAADHDLPTAASISVTPAADAADHGAGEPATAAAESHVAHSDDHGAHDDHAQHADATARGDDGHDHNDHGDDDHSDHGTDAHGDDDHDDDEDDEHGENAEEDAVESVGGDDVMEEVPERAHRSRRQYKIQEVIKRRQVMLVQVVKEERGNKGAALTTYLSLAGRYAVLMPNTARGGGISRKITSAQDRSRLKDVVQDLDVPEGMGIILRTAGAARTKPEIKRDFEYLIRMWETVRDMTLRSQAPTLVYEEGSLIKRSLRDLYNKEIDEVLVAGAAGYNEARDFMKMLMPSNVRAVKQYRDGQPLFSRMGVESQLDAMFSPTVTLRSGGYIVINQTEALVSIDVNSGRSTREHHIEDTALKTNLEAAEEVARQLRLRDLAGLVVIDFIDMDEKRNNRAVERKMSDCLRQDRARIQVGRISHFGLLEMSRQRIRASMLESSTEPCPHCGGSGHIRSVSSVALQLLRGFEEALMKGPTHNFSARTRTDVALYVLNHKRAHLRDLESSFEVTLSVIADPSVSGLQSFVIERGELVHTPEAAKAILAAQVAAFPPEVEDTYVEDEYPDEEAEIVDAESGDGDEPNAEQSTESHTEDEDDEGPRRKRRRRRRGGRGSDETTTDSDQNGLSSASPDSAASGETQDESEGSDEDSDNQNGEANADQAAGGERRPRRRGRRGGRRRRGGADGTGPGEGLASNISDDLGPVGPSEAFDAVADLNGASEFEDRGAQPQATERDSASRDHTCHGNDVAAPVHHQIEEPSQAQPQPAEEAAKPARRHSTVREKVSFFFSDAPSEPVPSAPAIETPVEASAPSPEPTAKEPDSAPRRAGWWSRRSK